MHPDKIRFSDASERHVLLLGKLRKELLTLANDDETPDSPTVNDITEKLNDLALCYKNKYPRYYDLKVILGDLCKQFRALIKHTRFDDYFPTSCKPQRVTYSPNVLLSKSPGRDHFYWTDKRLQHLVYSYYMYLDNLKSDSSEQSSSCLATLKKIDWNVTIPMLRSKLDTIFKDYEEKSVYYGEFRIRIGKDTCIFFDHLVNLKWDLYKKKKDTTKSKSHGSTSRIQSFASSSGRMSLAAQRHAESTRIVNELSELGLSKEQFAVAVIKLSELNLRSSYFACSAEQRKCIVEQLIK